MLLIFSCILLVTVFCYSYKFLTYSGNKLFIVILCFSTAYYGLLGPWYWSMYHNGYFLGANWLEEISNLPVLYVSVFCIIAIVFCLFERHSIKSEPSSENFSKVPKFSRLSVKVANIMLFIGILSSFYVYLKSGTFNKMDRSLSDPFLFIFYQFSDLVIPSLLFVLSSGAVKRKIYLITMIWFVIFCVYVGLRYKLLLLFGPFLIASYLSENNSVIKKGTVFFASVIVVCFFSVMTLSRQKFSGLKLDSVEVSNFDSLMYGLFAETNSVFGLASTIENFGSRYNFAMFNPLIEVIVQFIPRFLFPQKDLYGHLEQIAYGIALSEHSVRSGTTVPFFGEYYAMFGWPGIFVGTLIFTVVALKIINLCGSLSVTYRQYLLSVSLISLYAGYYYYSRGSIAQIFKGGIFILLPYFLLLWLQRKSRFRF